MGISKTKNGSFRLRVYIPDEVQGKLGLGKRYEKRFKTRREAKEAEIKLLPQKIREIYCSKIFTRKFGLSPIRQGKLLQL